MGKLFYIMGKSSSGKDTIYADLLARAHLGLEPVVTYTTRPIRANETDGVQYHFVTEDTLHRMQQEGSVIELRMYPSVCGPWYYFTADTEAIDLARQNYLAVGTLESFRKLKSYYGEDRVLPIYIEVGDRERLLRAIRREEAQATPNYKEVCRRYVADEEDFTEEKIAQAGITRRFANDGECRDCIRAIEHYIQEQL